MACPSTFFNPPSVFFLQLELWIKSVNLTWRLTCCRDSVRWGTDSTENGGFPEVLLFLFQSVWEKALNQTGESDTDFEWEKEEQV